MYTQGPFDIVMEEMDRARRSGSGSDRSDRCPFGRLQNSDLTPLIRPDAAGHSGVPPSTSWYRKCAIKETAFITMQN